MALPAIAHHLFGVLSKSKEFHTYTACFAKTRVIKYFQRRDRTRAIDSRAWTKSVCRIEVVKVVHVHPSVPRRFPCVKRCSHQMGYAIIDEVDEIPKVIRDTRPDHLRFLRHLSGVPDSGISIKNSFPLGDSGPLE